MIRNQNEIIINEDESKTCQFDGKKFDSSREMLNYVKRTYDKITSYEDYIIEAYYNGNRPTCLKTGKQLKFKANKLGPWFKNYTKNAFPRKKHTHKTKQKIKQNTQKSIKEKYGVDNVFKTEWCKRKIKNTLLKKYGVDNIMKSTDIISNFDFSKSEKTLEQTKKTNKQKYNSDWVVGSDYFKEKNKKTLKEKYDVTNVSQLDWVKQKQLESYWNTMKSKTSYSFVKKSSLESDFETKLKKVNIEYVSPFNLNGRKYDFYIKKLDCVIEIDGEAYHKDILENLTFQTINTSINDFNKDNICKSENKKIFRIRYDSNKFQFNDIDELLSKLKKYKYDRQYSLSYKQIICKKEYFEKYKDVKGIEKLEKNSKLLLKFIRKFSKEFPIIETNETFENIKNVIQTYDFPKIYSKQNKTFNNNCSSIGCSFLKSKFNSFWKSKYKKSNYSPYDAWYDGDIINDIIKYRMGCNNSNEIFDFSLYQIIRGLSARRLTVSFFKPLLAASIYHVLLQNKTTPIVVDPCCGFGGRLLGFKSLFPNGTYIGCEPNIETYNELISLIEDYNMNNVKIYNKKWEDFNISDINYDIIFTSIPYYDLELYSNDIVKTEYSDFNDWKNKFLNKFLNLKNCYLNINEEIYDKIKNYCNREFYITNNSTHFSKSKNKKQELIIKII